MVTDDDIIFVTNSILSKWINYQSNLIKLHFPNSKHIIINGSTKEFGNRWPNSWFDWLYEIKKCNQKYYIHIDEDFFLTNREELFKVLNRMENENIDIIGVSEGFNHYRSANPIAVNTFLMIGRVSDVKKIDLDRLSKAKYSLIHNGKEYTWINDLNIKYKEEYSNGFNYNFPIIGGCNYDVEQEPYYSFLWTLKEMGCKFDYLYPYFDDRFKSTNPRISENSTDIGIHMWYVRNWNDNFDVWGLPNFERYNRVEKYLIENV